MKRYPWLVPVLLALFSLAVSAFVGYSQQRETTNVSVASRLSALETKQQDDRDRLQRIEQKIDAILQQMIVVR